MLILIGTVPTAYALNHAIPGSQTQDFIAVSQQAVDSLGRYAPAGIVISDPRAEVTDYVRTRTVTEQTVPATRQLIGDISADMGVFKELSKVPAEKTRNFRNDMYLVSETLRLFDKSGQPQIAPADKAVLKNYKKHIDNATKFIPGWGRWPLLSGWGRWSGGSGSWSRSAKRSAKIT